MNESLKAARAAKVAATMAGVWCHEVTIEGRPTHWTTLRERERSEISGRSNGVTLAISIRCAMPFEQTCASGPISGACGWHATNDVRVLIIMDATSVTSVEASTKPHAHAANHHQKLRQGNFAVVLLA